MEQLVEQLHDWQLLTMIDLSDCIRDDRVFAAVCASMKRMQNLKYVYLRSDNERNRLHDVGMSALADYVRSTTTLLELSLRTNQMTFEHSDCYRALQCHTNLLSLELGDLDDSNAAPLIGIVRGNSTLTSLVFNVDHQVRWIPSMLQEFCEALAQNQTLFTMRNCDNRSFGNKEAVYFWLFIF